MMEQSKAHGEFSVWCFSHDGTYYPEVRHVTDEIAMYTLGRMCCSVAAQTGLITKVIVTDGGDSTNIEWIHGKGFTFPPEMVGKQPGPLLNLRPKNWPLQKGEA